MRFSAILAIFSATFSLSAAASYYMPAPNSISTYSDSTSTEACESLNSSTAASTHKDKHTATEAVTVTSTKIKTVTDTEVITCTEIKYQTDTKTITEKETITYSTTIFKNACSSTPWPAVKTTSSYANTSTISDTFVPAKPTPSCTDEFTHTSTAKPAPSCTDESSTSKPAPSCTDESSTSKPAPSCTDESTYTSTSTAAMKNSPKPSYTMYV